MPDASGRLYPVRERDSQIVTQALEDVIASVKAVDVVEYCHWLYTEGPAILARLPGVTGTHKENDANRVRS